MKQQSEYDLILSITTLAIAISKQISNNDELFLLAASIQQLGETLETIALHRERVPFIED